MASPLQTTITGAVLACVLAFMLIVPSIDGISTWKYVLAGVGFLLLVMSGATARK